MMNENAISNILMDVDFLEEEFKRAGKPHLMAAFAELRAVRVPVSVLPVLRPWLTLAPAQITSIALDNNVQQFLSPPTRQSTYLNVRAKRLQSLLEKLARYGGQCRDSASREKGERRRKEAEAIGRTYPVETR